MAKTQNKPFKDWLYEEVGQAFGLKRKYQHPLFDMFQELPLEATEMEQQTLIGLQELAFKYVDTWNEDEYKFMFISRLIGLANFVSEYYKVFTQRAMSIEYDNGTKTTEGLVEFMLAKGLQTPQKPHFFLHEYKPEKRRDNDPLGQLLIAMIGSQIKNQDEKPIYGIYVNGRYWHFVVLEGAEYAVSNSYNVSDSAIFRLFAILVYFRNLMEEMYKNMG